MTVDEFIGKWSKSGGNERANTQLFITDLCDLLELPRPDPTQTNVALNDYVFERHVTKTEIDGTTSNGWVDLYRRDRFILEAKQGSDADRAAVDAGHGDSLRDFFGQTAADRFKRGMAKRGTGQWAAAMQRAAGQAEGYAKALPADHGWPPILLVSDIGHCIDVYADFQRSGKGYAPFPDRRRFRIKLDDLRHEEVRDRLKALWTDPMSLDPAIEAANVTREVAGILADLAKRLEKEHEPEKVAGFLMRLLFTMFAEDIGFRDKKLLPEGKFTELLERQLANGPEHLPQQLSQLWKDMDKGGFSGALGLPVSKFNGYLFKDRTALPLTEGEIGVLIEAAKKNWSKVEPAIFGTLLERALNPKERAKLGAHYTPRAYVERLVGPTIMEPLRDDWLGARTAAMEAAESGDQAKAREIVEEFHGKLARTKVLDPACGTGNFLYVAMARMKELEGEVLELLEELGDRQYLAELSGHTITPHNFLGIEINERAVEIAQLVLWIGYIQWHFRVTAEGRMPVEPILDEIRTIEHRDALIEYDRKELERDERGQPVTRWDGETMKKHPVTGKDVPDETARVEVYRYVNPRAAKWPKADFIIGNPPFHGARTIRSNMPAGYIEAVRRAHSTVPENADIVMFWWDRAASSAARNRIRRFGFVSTNSIVQSFSRKVVKKHLEALDSVRLVAAIPDHPWVDEKDGAAVRIAMTVGERRARKEAQSRLLTVTDERKAPDEILFDESFGKISSDLRIGPRTTGAQALKSNRGLSSVGYQLTGQGFEISPAFVQGLSDKERSEFIFGLINASDVIRYEFSRKVVDACHVRSAPELMDASPLIYQQLLTHVKPERDVNSRRSVRENWWVFGEARNTFRPALEGLGRQMVTPITSKHRIFCSVSTNFRPDSTCVCFAFEDWFFAGVLSSRIHYVWSLTTGSSLEDRPRYTKAECFDPFPFPDPVAEPLKQRIRDAAEKLDGLRKQVLERHEDLTLTKLYNVLVALREAEAKGVVLSDKDRDIAERGCVSLIRQYHDEIDVAVAEAYGWGDLILPGTGRRTSEAGGGAGSTADSTPPSALRAATSPFRGGSDETILERLVALNKERAAEEAKGKVRWLRPEFQAPGYIAPKTQEALPMAEPVKVAEVLEWPSKLAEQVVAVTGVVEQAGRPVDAAGVARAFKGKRAASVLPVLDALAGMGRLRKLEGERFAA